MTKPNTSQLPPGPRRHWLLGTGQQQIKDPLGMLVRGHKRYGDVVYFHMFEGPTYLLCNPQHAQQVMMDNARNYPHKGPPEGVVGPLLGRGLFASRGEFWMRQRRMVQPAFHRPRLASMVDTLVQGTQVMAERWEAQRHAGRPVELLEEMRHLVISLLCMCTFSHDAYERHAPLREAVDFLNADAHGPRDSLLKTLPLLLGMRRGARRQRLRAVIASLNSVLYALIAERRQAPAPAEDILSMLMDARDPQGEGMTDTQVRDELVSLIIGGQEATAVALTWCWLSLLRHPHVEQRVRREVAEVLGDQPVTGNTLPALHYTRAVVEETLRLYPPAWQFVRQALNEDSIGGYRVTPGTLLMISPYLLHRHASAWEQPEQFLPERFLPEQRERVQRQAYMPFGAGQRMCVGNHFALMLMTTALATLMQRFQARLVPEHPLTPMAASTYRPRHGVQVTLQPAPAAS